MIQRAIRAVTYRYPQPADNIWKLLANIPAGARRAEVPPILRYVSHGTEGPCGRPLRWSEELTLPIITPSVVGLGPPGDAGAVHELGAAGAGGAATYAARNATSS